MEMQDQDGNEKYQVVTVQWFDRMVEQKKIAYVDKIKVNLLEPYEPVNF